MTEKHGHMHHGKSSRDILDAEVVLKAAGLKNGDVFLDAGCGDGFISIDASSVVGDTGKVYAVDVYPESIENVKNEIADKNLTNIDALVVDITEKIPLDDDSVDNVIMANVLHGFVAGDEVEPVMNGITRVLKPGGIFAVVEFRKVKGTHGPPFNVRISSSEVDEILSKYGFNVAEIIELSEYHYLIKGVKT